LIILRSTSKNNFNQPQSDELEYSIKKRRGLRFINTAQSNTKRCREPRHVLYATTAR